MRLTGKDPGSTLLDAQSGRVDAGDVIGMRLIAPAPLEVGAAQGGGCIDVPQTGSNSRSRVAERRSGPALEG